MSKTKIKPIVKTEEQFVEQLNKQGKYVKMNLTGDDILVLAEDLLSNQKKWNTYHENAGMIDDLRMNGFGIDTFGTLAGDYIIAGVKGKKHIKVIAYDITDKTYYILDPHVWGMRLFM